LRGAKCWSLLDLDLRPADRVLPNGWTELVALLAAFLISALTTPAGISGAVLLLPFQVSVLGMPGPSVTPTNLRGRPPSASTIATHSAGSLSGAAQPRW